MWQVDIQSPTYNSIGWIQMGQSSVFARLKSSNYADPYALVKLNYATGTLEQDFILNNVVDIDPYLSYMVYIESDSVLYVTY